MFVIASFFIILCLARHHGTNALKMDRLSCSCWIWIILAVLFTPSRPRPLVLVVCFFGRFASFTRCCFATTSLAAMSWGIVVSLFVFSSFLFLIAFVLLVFILPHCRSVMFSFFVQYGAQFSLDHKKRKLVFLTLE